MHIFAKIPTVTNLRLRSLFKKFRIVFYFKGQIFNNTLEFATFHAIKSPYLATNNFKLSSYGVFLVLFCLLHYIVEFFVLNCLLHNVLFFSMFCLLYNDVLCSVYQYSCLSLCIDLCSASFLCIIIYRWIACRCAMAADLISASENCLLA